MAKGALRPEDAAVSLGQISVVDDNMLYRFYVSAQHWIATQNHSSHGHHDVWARDSFINRNSSAFPSLLNSHLQ